MRHNKYKEVNIFFLFSRHCQDFQKHACYEFMQLMWVDNKQQHVRQLYIVHAKTQN
jgi:hypothetical protein